MGTLVDGGDGVALFLSRCDVVGFSGQVKHTVRADERDLRHTALERSTTSTSTVQVWPTSALPL